jgi:hypothetical protein
MGTLFYDSISKHDFPILMGILMVMAIRRWTGLGSGWRSADRSQCRSGIMSLASGNLSSIWRNQSGEILPDTGSG